MKKKGLLYNLGLITIVLITIQSYYLYNIVIPEIEKKNIALQEQKTQLSAERSRLNNLIDLNKQKNKIYQLSATIQNALPTEENQTSIPYHLSSLAEKNKVSITMDMKGSGSDKTIDVSYVTVAATITGNYKEVVDFFQSLYQSNRITTTDNVNINSLGGDQISLSLFINFYHKA